MYIKHSKFKNTGILFEILVKRITADTLSNGDSPAINTLRKYFVNTELGKEYKLYEMVFKGKNVKENKANAILNTVIESSKKLNRTRLRKEKYNLIKELKENYNTADLFKTKISDYKTYASLYTLFEVYNTENPTDPNQIVDNKVIILEHLTSTPIERDNVKGDIIEEFKSYDKDVRILTYRILLEKFNEKYSDLSPTQKRILKEFINSVDNTSSLKDFYNTEVQNIKKTISEQIKVTKDKIIQIKLEEVSKLINELNKKDKVKTDHLVDLLQYHSLLNELNKVHASL
jgi:hypothetical protein|tara:strand:+ start:1686 stop:2549 length:864 start_codon:yes stop_codon:yes gene_type:complete